MHTWKLTSLGIGLMALLNIQPARAGNQAEWFQPQAFEPGQPDYDWGYDEGPGRHQHRGMFDDSSLQLSFSFGEGIYMAYGCDYDSCDEVLVTPADFELLLGFRITPYLYLDISAVWAIDYEYYGTVTYMAGFRPGVRLVFPGLFHHFYYLRAAVPVTFGVSGENDDTLIGLLLGAGVEWRFANMGIFGEIDILPYFVEVYDGYHVIPAQGRLGLSVHF